MSMDSFHVVRHLVNYKQPARVLKNKLTKLNIVPQKNTDDSASWTWTLALLFLSNSLVNSCMSVALLCISAAGLNSASTFHFTHHIRSEG